MDFISIIMFVLLGIAIGYIYREIVFLKEIVNLVNKLNRKVQEEIHLSTNDKKVAVKQVKKLKHEIINDVNYFFLDENNTFIGQGRTLPEAALQCYVSLGNDVMGFFVHADSEQKFCFVNKECLELVDE